MDRWKYFDITHRFHVVCNPTSLAKIEELIGLFRLKPGSSVLDIACGKAEMLVRLAEAYDIRGVGVDLSPYAVRDAEELKRRRVPDSDLEFVTANGADFHAENTNNFDLAMCIGASWIWDGHRGTLKAMMDMTKPGGIVAVGEPFFTQEPSEEYLVAEDFSRDDFSTHYGNIQIAEEEGFAPLYTMVSNQDDWDRYETLQWMAVDEFAQNNPDDPDLTEIKTRNAESREIYLKWGRDGFNWAIYLFRKPA
jgi:ubiquinone/menaquinone biosynthesis C-methylase UbiE